MIDFHSSYTINNECMYLSDIDQTNQSSSEQSSFTPVPCVCVCVCVCVDLDPYSLVCVVATYMYLIISFLCLMFAITVCHLSLHCRFWQ